MAKLYNLARMTTATTGTGTITLGSAVTGWLSFANAGVQNGDTVTYAIVEGNNREVGRGVYTSSGTTLTRSVLNSTASGSPITLAGSAVVFITAASQDFGSTVYAEIGPYAPPLASYFGTSFKNATPTTTLTDVTGRGLQVAITGFTGADQRCALSRSTGSWGTAYKVRMRAISALSFGQYPGVGLGFYDSAGGKALICWVYSNNGSLDISMMRHSDISTFSANALLVQNVGAPVEWFEVERNGANLFLRVSSDGVNFNEYSEAFATYIGVAPTHVVAAVNTPATSFPTRVAGGLITYWDDPDFPASSVQVGLNGR